MNISVMQWLKNTQSSLFEYQSSFTIGMLWNIIDCIQTVHFEKNVLNCGFWFAKLERLLGKREAYNAKGDYIIKIKKKIKREKFSVIFCLYVSSHCMVMELLIFFCYANKPFYDNRFCTRDLPHQSHKNLLLTAPFTFSGH